MTQIWFDFISALLSFVGNVVAVSRGRTHTCLTIMLPRGDTCGCGHLFMALKLTGEHHGLIQGSDRGFHTSF